MFAIIKKYCILLACIIKNILFINEKGSEDCLSLCSGKHNKRPGRWVALEERLIKVFTIHTGDHTFLCRISDIRNLRLIPQRENLQCYSKRDSIDRKGIHKMSSLTHEMKRQSHTAGRKDLPYVSMRQKLNLWSNS